MKEYPPLNGHSIQKVFMSLRVEANVIDDVYLPRIRQQAEIWQFSSTKMMLVLQ
jgi:hypothetical protein